MVEYRKTKQLDNKVGMAAALFVNDEKMLTEDWMQGANRAEQWAGIRKRIAEQVEYAADYREIAAAGEEIHEAIKKMASVVWSGWLQRYYRKSDDRGHIAVVGGVETLVWGCAGRVRLDEAAANVGLVQRSAQRNGQLVGVGVVS
jgi:urease accessory protein UreF